MQSLTAAVDINAAIFAQVKVTQDGPWLTREEIWAVQWIIDVAPRMTIIFFQGHAVFGTTRYCEGLYVFARFSLAVRGEAESPG